MLRVMRRSRSPSRRPPWYVVRMPSSPLADLVRTGRAGLMASLVLAALGCTGPSRPATPVPAPAPPPPPAFDPSPWRADYLELRDALSAGYANLEWAIAH